MTDLLLLAALILLVRELRNGRSRRRSDNPVRTAPANRSSREGTVADLAFDYARAVLELDHMSEETKSRALRALEWEILPLAGKVPLADVTEQLQLGVRAVLFDRFEGDARAAAVVWDDLLRWGGVRPQDRRGRWH